LSGFLVVSLHSVIINRKKANFAQFTNDSATH